MSQPKCYWITGPLASGKTTLARKLVGDENLFTMPERGPAMTALRKLARLDRVGFDDFVESEKTTAVLRGMADNSSPFVCVAGRGRTAEFIFDFDVVVVVSDSFPICPSLNRRFKIITCPAHHLL